MRRRADRAATETALPYIRRRTRLDGAATAERRSARGPSIDARRYAEVRRSPDADGARPRAKAYYFSVRTGRLVGSEGTGLSTLVFHGSQRLGGLTLPDRVTRFRVEDGQEHVIKLTAAGWLESPADLFELPAPIRRILRTPADLERDGAALRKRFARALGRYRAKDKSSPLRDDIVELRVREGDLRRRLDTQVAPAFKAVREKIFDLAVRSYW